MTARRSSAPLLARQWQEGGWLSDLLRPLAALVRRHTEKKRADYLQGRKPSWRAPVPVVVVGNIYVGGTGKTPVVIAAVQALRERGYTPGVVSRGYGVKIGPAPRVGRGELPAGEFGDEPALIARATGAPVAVHPRRPLAAQALLRAHPEVDLIVSDDGLQHLALARDVEIVVQDARGVGNGRLLPAGPLREPPERLDEVDLIVTNQAGPDTPPPQGKAGRAAPGRAASGRAASGRAASGGAASGRAAPGGAASGHPRRVAMWLRPGLARRLTDGAERPLSDFAGQPGVAAAAGIGNPDRFFATLKAAGVEPGHTLPLPDHHDYARSPFGALGARTILITSKDAIKCAALHDDRLWEVPVRAEFSDPRLFDWLAARLRGKH